MRLIHRLLDTAALLAGVVASACPVVARAQVFEADYQLVRPAAATEANVDFSRLRVVPLIQSGADFSGAGLSIVAGAHWFGQLGMGRGNGMQPNSYSRNAIDMVNLGAGYRFSNGQALSLQLSQGRGSGQRLGLAVNYDWPQYFVRFSYDQGANLVPQDNLRFSAGVRF